MEHGIVTLQELHESWNDSALNDAFNWWILLLGEEFAEFGGRVQLTIGIIGEDSLNHILRQLENNCQTLVD